MSSSAFTRTWESAPLKGARLLLALAFADEANQDEVFASHPMGAEQAAHYAYKARITTDQLSRYLEEFRTKRYVEVDGRHLRLRVEAFGD